MSKMEEHGRPLISLTIIVTAALLIPGCATKAGTGALLGGGVGGVIGGAAGGWEGAAIGTAVGIGAGYIVGNEADKEKAKSYTSGTVTYIPADELTPFSGSKWKLVKVFGDAPMTFKTLSVEFLRNGIAITTRTAADGLTAVVHERYRVVGEVLIINRPGYVLNFTWSIRGDRLFLKDRNRQRSATLRRVN